MSPLAETRAQAPATIDAVAARPTRPRVAKKEEAPASDTESTTNASSVGRTCASSVRVKIAELVPWGEIALGNKILPHCNTAFCVADVFLLSAFLEMAGLQDCSGGCVKLLLRTLKFLRLCDYSAEDMCSILAHSCEYVKDVLEVCGGRMDDREVGNVVVCLTFMAHSWIQDETCPLRVWHRHIFRDYCSIGTLNLAVVRLFELRRYRMRLPSQCIAENMRQLLGAIPWPSSMLQPSA